jgi:hypothetical protein
MIRKRENFGNLLFVVLRARRACITEHRSISAALSLTMHVGATPSGPEPSGNPAFCAGLIFSRLAGNAPICRVRTPKLVISPLYAATIQEFSERGSRSTGRGANPAARGTKGLFPLAVRFLKVISPPTGGANAIIHYTQEKAPRKVFRK